MRPARLLFAFGVLAAATASALACDSQFGDTPAPIVIPKPEGKEDRISEIRNPDDAKKAAHGSQVKVSGAVVVAVDTFDETHNGRSAGTIYVADMASDRPYSGISLFNPSFVPGNLRVGAGDVLDLNGTYQENVDVPLKFGTDTPLVQISGPVASFRYEATVPPPVEISIEDLRSYEKGRQWLNMIVTVKGVTVGRDLFPATGSGRLSAGLAEDTPRDGGARDCEPFPTSPQIVNELMDIAPLEIAQGTKLKSLTGLVTFFCNLHIAPRTPADIVKE